MRYNIRKRDGLARTATLELDGARQPLPAAADWEDLFPALCSLSGTNLPLCAPAHLVQVYPPPGSGQPVQVHPFLDNRAQSGDCVMVAGWHIAFANPRSYVDWLIGLKEKTPADTAWYAPAAALPSNVATLCYSGFDLFDYRAVDLRSAQDLFCIPEGEFPADMQKGGTCSCAGCRNGDLREHNREALCREVALAARFIEAGMLRDLVESRCRLDANQVAILRHLDNHYPFMEQHLPIARSGVMRANSGESIQRAEVRRFAERV